MEHKYVLLFCKRKRGKLLQKCTDMVPSSTPWRGTVFLLTELSDLPASEVRVPSDGLEDSGSFWNRSSAESKLSVLFSKAEKVQASRIGHHFYFPEIICCVESWSSFKLKLSNKDQIHTLRVHHLPSVAGRWQTAAGLKCIICCSLKENIWLPCFIEFFKVVGEGVGHLYRQCNMNLLQK